MAEDATREGPPRPGLLLFSTFCALSTFCTLCTAGTATLPLAPITLAPAPLAPFASTSGFLGASLVLVAVLLEPLVRFVLVALRGGAPAPGRRALPAAGHALLEPGHRVLEDLVRLLLRQPDTAVEGPVFGRQLALDLFQETSGVLLS